MTYKRPSWDEYFMGIVDAVSTRATCDRGRTAVVFVKDKIILTTGYVGSPAGTDHCDDVGHLMKSVTHSDGSVSKHCMRTNHAEINAVALAAKKGISIDGASMYCKLAPCYTCAKMLINTGVVRVVCQKKYHKGQESAKMLENAGIKIEFLEDDVEDYTNQ
ncbi:MAG: cell division protein DedD [Candidatus Altiarchaeota archaeon]|nr:cell division protein DedD [Candidatus Altiarchaeota archaeon]